MKRVGDITQVSQSEPSPDQQVTPLFNAAVAAHALATADELGLLDSMHQRGHVDLELQGDGCGEPPGLDYLIHVLELVGVIERVSKSGRVVPGPAFEAAYSYKGFFTWLFAASGSVLASAASVMRAGPGVAAPRRDGRLIGRASGDFGRTHLDPSILALPEWSDTRCVVDIGCGDGSRVIRLAEAWPLDAVGIEVSPEAAAEARTQVTEAGLTQRIEIVTGDARALTHERDRLARVDTLFSALMGHDLWPRAMCIETLRLWREWFPGARRLILCETVRVEQDVSFQALRIPTLGYEYLHSVMGQYIPTESEWLDVLAEAGWPVTRRTMVSVPAQTVILVCERSQALSASPAIGVDSHITGRLP